MLKGAAKSICNLTTSTLPVRKEQGMLQSMQAMVRRQVRKGWEHYGAGSLRLANWGSGSTPRGLTSGTSGTPTISRAIITTAT